MGVEVGMRESSPRSQSDLMSKGLKGVIVHRERLSRHVSSSRKVFLRLGEPEDRQRNQRPQNRGRKDDRSNLFTKTSRGDAGLSRNVLRSAVPRISFGFLVKLGDFVLLNGERHLGVSNGVAWKRTQARSRSVLLFINLSDQTHLVLEELERELGKVELEKSGVD
ncbi:hypothetical protein Tco_0216385 [Tanacetum coccineum]